MKTSIDVSSHRKLLLLFKVNLAVFRIFKRSTSLFNGVDVPYGISKLSVFIMCSTAFYSFRINSSQWSIKGKFNCDEERN